MKKFLALLNCVAILYSSMAFSQKVEIFDLLTLKKNTFKDNDLIAEEKKRRDEINQSDEYRLEKNYDIVKGDDLSILHPNDETGGSFDVDGKSYESIKEFCESEKNNCDDLDTLVSAYQGKFFVEGSEIKKLQEKFEKGGLGREELARACFKGGKEGKEGKEGKAGQKLFKVLESNLKSSSETLQNKVHGRIVPVIEKYWKLILDIKKNTTIEIDPESPKENRNTTTRTDKKEGCNSSAQGSREDRKLHDVIEELMDILIKLYQNKKSNNKKNVTGVEFSTDTSGNARTQTTTNGSGIKVETVDEKTPDSNKDDSNKDDSNKDDSNKDDSNIETEPSRNTGTQTTANSSGIKVKTVDEKTPDSNIETEHSSRSYWKKVIDKMNGLFSGMKKTFNLFSNRKKATTSLGESDDDDDTWPFHISL